MTILIVLVLLAVAFGMREFWLHKKHVREIPVRIHINGTRGKSSVTRLIAGALRAGGVATVGKTTGSAPRILLEDGSEIPIVRARGANIIEQIRVFTFLSKRKPKVIVIECMAVMPEYQWIAEQQIVCSTIGVITNARPDHLREMGPSVENVALSLCNTIPFNKVAFTCEKKLLPLMQGVAQSRKTTLHGIVDDDISEDDMRPFQHIEHKENVALALAVVAELGVNREVALEGMYRAAPDSGALKRYQINTENKSLSFINALAANDPESTLAIWERVIASSEAPGSTIFILNTRMDRFDRSVQLVEMVYQDTKFDKLVLIGESCDRLLGVCYSMGLPASKVLNLGSVFPEVTWRAILDLPFERMSLFAIGNVHGGGHEVAHYFRDRSVA
jgi:gamma-polyglutamate synthase